MDLEANRFAIELLMPEEWINRDCKGIDIFDEKAISKVARKYKVPTHMMAARMLELSQAN